MYANSELDKKEVCLSAIDQFDCVTSTQALNEMCSVLTKKLHTPINTIKQLLGDIFCVSEVKYIQSKTIHYALELSARYGYSYYDSLMLAAALESNCDIILTEDMSNGQIIDNKLKIINPFKSMDMG